MDKKPKKKLTRQRTTTEQLETYIDFLENKPNFLGAKDTPKNPKFLEEAWIELAIKLNEQKGPTKTPKEWNQSLGHWRNQLKFRARKKKKMLLTGGSVDSAQEFTEFEDRALRCFGPVSICGDEGISMLDFKNVTIADNHSNIERSSEDLSLSSSDEVPSSSSLTSSTKPRKRTHSTIWKFSKKILKLAEKRIATENQLAQKRLQTVEMNVQSMAEIGDKKPKKNLTRQRTTTEQLGTYIDFLENKPNFLGAKDTPKNPKFLEEAWIELAIKLNAQKGPSKTPKEWKQSLGHWRNQLKFRARKKKKMLLTGGSVDSAQEFTEFEDRALRCFGPVSICGDEGISMLDFKNVTIADNDNHSNIERSSEDLSLSSSDEVSSSSSSSLTSSTKPRKRTHSTIWKFSKKFLKLAEKRIAFENQMAQKRLQIDEMNAQSMAKIADSMNIMVTLLSKK